MYVRKFEADTLEDALKNIKRELGPDAIVLKTVTNKGLKGAFKKKKIEITAAISEKNYTQKAKVDAVLPEEKKEEFYQSSSSFVANQIESYNKSANTAAAAKKSGYGNIGLNRPVQKRENDQLSNSLDDFLSTQSTGANNAPVIKTSQSEFADVLDESQNFQNSMPSIETKRERQFVEEKQVVETVPAQNPSNESVTISQDLLNKLEKLVEVQELKIHQLESKVHDLTNSLNNISKQDLSDDSVLREVGNKLRALGVGEEYIHQLVKKISFEFEETEGNFEEVLDFVLNQMMNGMNIKMPLFSTNDNSESASTITLFVSQATCGQSSICRKIAGICPDSKIIRLGDSSDQSFTDSMLGLDVLNVKHSSEVFTECRRNMSEGMNTFVDYKVAEDDENLKKFIKGLKRSFDKVEVFSTISAIHSETYNESVLNRFNDISDGIVINQLDNCLDFGMLFNLNQKFEKTPFVFYGIGDVVPDDLEAATSERVLAGMFKLN